MLKYYSFTRRTFKWTKKVVFYFLQVALYNSYVLYSKYTRDKKKLTLLQYQEMAVDALTNFETEMWPDSGTRIPHAPDLPFELRKFRPSTALQETAAPAVPPMPTKEDVGTPAEEDEEAVDDPAPGPSFAPVPGPSDAPATSSATAAAPAATPAAATPKRRRTRLVDPYTRLEGPHQHYFGKLTDVRQKRCRVCLRNGKRKETSYQCIVCQMPLCLLGNCFRLYHTKVKFWGSPSSSSKDQGRRRRQQ